MKNQNYWKTHYVIETGSDEIERNLNLASFVADNQVFELPYFAKRKDAPTILISQGSGGHSYVFAELAYQMHLRGYSVFVMPKHGGYSINQLLVRHVAALEYISSHFNDRIGIFSEGLGGYVVFYMALAHGAAKSIVCQNSPAVMTEKEYQRALVTEGGQWAGMAQRRKVILPLARLLVRNYPIFNCHHLIWIGKQSLTRKRKTGM